MTTTATPGAGIRTLRKLANMTIDEVAEKTGSSASYLSRVERGQLNPSKAFLSKAATVIADGLKVAA